MMLTKFIRCHHRDTVNQVCPRDYQIFQDQISEQDVQNDKSLKHQQRRVTVFFSKLVKSRYRFALLKKLLYRNFFDNTGKIVFEQVIVPPDSNMPKIGNCMISLCRDSLKQFENRKKLALRKPYKIPHLNEHVMRYVNNFIECIKSQPPKSERVNTPPEMIYYPATVLNLFLKLN